MMRSWKANDARCSTPKPPIAGRDAGASRRLDFQPGFARVQARIDSLECRKPAVQIWYSGRGERNSTVVIPKENSAGDG
ncbi:hypothetical protein GUJ93_ZPchr0004g38162 [Zizania palustris]|uniref:Uncharacterized protein n=1 Tax=Zizania palustris TaxID=103762 RepID=A0A8J5SPW6_ZIZPA|nr:hypothetical protein GUJ93_ZPchr0004g38162 [Zizania palustris]